MNNMLQNEEAMDGLLHDYFKSEVPHPFPAFQAPLPVRTKRPASLWSRYSGRIALAACITALVAGYLTIAGYFPRVQVGNGMEQVVPNIAQKEKGNGIVPPNADDPMPVER